MHRHRSTAATVHTDYAVGEDPHASRPATPAPVHGTTPAPQPRDPHGHGGNALVCPARAESILTYQTNSADRQAESEPTYNWSRSSPTKPPDTIATLTDHEIHELEARDLWFDWTEPPRPGEFGPEPEDEDGDDDAPKKGGGKRGGSKPAGPRRDTVTSPRQALEAIKNLSRA